MTRNRGGRKRRGNLVMERHPGQSIYVGRSITITILAIQDNGAISVAIEAPKWMAISRDDITEDEHMAHQERRERESAEPCGKCGRTHVPGPCITLDRDEVFAEQYRHGSDG